MRGRGLWVRAAIALATILVASAQGAAFSPRAPEAAPRCSSVGAEYVRVPVEALDATLNHLYDSFHDLPGFLDAYYYGGHDFRVSFLYAIPAGAYLGEAGWPIAFDVVPSSPIPRDPGPLPSGADLACDGIRPGDDLNGGCTLNFVFTDGTELYMGTAGHCLGVGQVVGTRGFARIGVGVFSTGNAGVGNDFALVRIDADKRAFVSPEMCSWGGPTQVQNGPIVGLAVFQTGNGNNGLVGMIPSPRPRLGDGVGWGATSFSYLGQAWGGDSGSPARAFGGGALGTVTHTVATASGLVFGTRIDHGLALAAAAGLPNLQLVTTANLHPA